MKKGRSYIVIGFLLSSFLLVSCGNSSKDSSGKQVQGEVWNSQSVLDLMIDLKTLKTWGYYDDSASDDLKVVDFKSENSLTDLKVLKSVKPEVCLPLGIFLEQSSLTQADFLLIQNVSDSSILPKKSMIYNAFVFNSVELAMKKFEDLKKVASDCGLYVAQFADENIDRDLWSSTENEENSVKALNTEYDEANLIGINNNVIYILYFMEYENLNGAKEKLNLARQIINSNIAKID